MDISVSVKFWLEIFFVEINGQKGWIGSSRIWLAKYAPPKMDSDMILSITWTSMLRLSNKVSSKTKKVSTLRLLKFKFNMAKLGLIINWNRFEVKHMCDKSPKTLCKKHCRMMIIWCEFIDVWFWWFYLIIICLVDKKGFYCSNT